MDPIIKCLLLKNDIVLISEIVEVGTELGEPDCKLTNPFKLNKQSNDANIPVIYGERLVGGTSGASIKPWEISYDSELRNEPE